MSDLISRADAINDAESWTAVDEHERHLQKNVIEWLKEFPTAELSTNLAEVGTDCISRQAAINAVRNIIPDNRSIGICDELEQLPPAEPEIICCKECKHNPKYEWFGCPMSHLSEKQRPETAWCWKAERRTDERSD